MNKILELYLDQNYFKSDPQHLQYLQCWGFKLIWSPGATFATQDRYCILLKMFANSNLTVKQLKEKCKNVFFKVPISLIMFQRLSIF